MADAVQFLSGSYGPFCCCWLMLTGHHATADAAIRRAMVDQSGSQPIATAHCPQSVVRSRYDKPSSKLVSFGLRSDLLVKRTGRTHERTPFQAARMCTLWFGTTDVRKGSICVRRLTHIYTDTHEHTHKYTVNQSDPQIVS